MKVLLVIDCQNDFCPGGSLAVEDGDRIIPIINKLSNSGMFDKIVATQDWHPEGHMSFASRYGVEPFTMNEDAGQMVWPVHCVQGTKGAELRPSLDQRPIQYIVRKGMDKEVESYSGFFDNNKQNRTALCSIIQDSCDGENPEDIEIYVVGIATDVCVLNTALDARILNWQGRTVVVEDAVAGVTEDGSKKALEQMKGEGIEVLNSKDII